jgi:hypothetical protein
MRKTLLLAALIIGITASGAHAAAPDSVFNMYLRAVLAGNWDEAKALWLPEEVVAAERLGVTYTGVPLKVDCSSPLLEHREAINSGVVTVTVTEPFRDEERMVVKRATLQTKSGQSVTATYLVVPREGHWYLTSRIWWETKSWRTRDTHYIRLYMMDTTLVNDVALAEMDRFVDSLFSLFQATPEQRTLLTKQKILYFFAGKETVQTLSAYDVHGVSYRPLDAVITSHLPHEHELTHVVADFVLSPLPMYSLAVLQEGLATACGGRWGKSPRVVLGLGAYILQSGLVAPDAILTDSGFHGDAATSDLAYAAAGVLTRFLVESLGWKHFSVLYRRFSGPQPYVAGLSQSEIERVLVEVTGQPWDGLVRSCIAIANESADHEAGIWPATPAHSAGPVIFESTTDSLTLRLFAVDSDLYLETSGLAAEREHGLVLTAKPAPAPTGYRSTLFAEHWPTVAYKGEAVGIVLEKTEAGIYDYRTNTLLAKFAAGFSNGQSFWDEKAKRNRVRIERAILPVAIDSVNFQVLAR